MSPTERVYDRDWYAKRIADPDTGEPRRFQGGPLGAVDFELDALYFGVEHENKRRELHDQVVAACWLPFLLFNGDTGAKQTHRLDQTAWLAVFDILWDPANVPGHLDPANAVNFRLDVLKAMAHLPKSYRRCIVHALDGYSLEEIAELMGWQRPVYTAIAQVRGFSINDAAIWDAENEPPAATLRLQTGTEPNTESAERVVRKASAEIRNRAALDIPGKQGREPRQNPVPTSVINDIEREIAETRAWRARELRRREQATTDRRAA